MLLVLTLAGLLPWAGVAALPAPCSLSSVECAAGAWTALPPVIEAHGDIFGLAEAGPVPQGLEIDIDFREFGSVLGWNFTRGLFSPENIGPLVTGSAATMVALPIDERFSDALRDDYASVASWVGESGNIIGSPVLQAATVGTLLLVSPFTENNKFRTFTFTLTQAVLLENALKYTLKLSISRERPDGSDDNAFPSGHTSGTTAFATVLHHYYGWKWGVPAYAVAGFVALSRIEKGKHYLSDVIFGATVGYIAGFTAIRGTDRSVSQRQLAVHPIVGRGKRGAIIVWQF